MNVCPQCGTSNRPEARFCKQCCTALLQDQSAPPAAVLECPHCEATLRPGARFCKQCGKPITAPLTPDDTRPTCPNCGAPVRDTSRFCPQCRAPLTAPSADLAKPTDRAVDQELDLTAADPARAPAPSSDLVPPAPPPSPPGRFSTGEMRPLTILAGRYTIVEKIAQGGMSAIYKAQDKRLRGKFVAVKEMSESAIAPAQRERVLDAFRREAELLARLEHPNLVRVTDRFQEGERHYIVMEFIEGQTLQKMLDECANPFPEELVLTWADQLCDVLFYLHNQNPKIIYRDVKPANVMVVAGTDTIKLIDFGIARFFKPGKGRDTIEFGTDGYAPPEQYGKSQTDEQSDVYALGATLHQLLTLHNPLTDLFNFPPIRSLNPQVGRRVAAAIAKAVEEKKQDRHQSIEEMALALFEDDAVQSLPSKRGRRRTAGGKKKARPAPAPLPHLPGQPASATTAVDFGPIRVGNGAPDQSLVVTFPASGVATLSTDSPWLQVQPQRVDKSGDQVTVILDTARLKPGRLQLQGGWLKRWLGWPARFLIPTEQEACAHVEIKSQGGQTEHVPVSVTVVPKTWRVRVGWIVTIGAVLLEIALVIGILGTLVIMVIAGAIF